MINLETFIPNFDEKTLKPFFNAYENDILYEFVKIHVEDVNEKLVLELSSQAMSKYITELILQIGRCYNDY